MPERQSDLFDTNGRTSEMDVLDTMKGTCQNCRAATQNLRIATGDADNKVVASCVAHGNETPHLGGVALISAERRRQLFAEGWALGHDDEHDMGELVMAAEAYAFAARCQVRCHPDDPLTEVADRVPNVWPWDEDGWKPSTDAVRNLVKAGALIAAEIDRLQRRA